MSRDDQITDLERHHLILLRSRLEHAGDRRPQFERELADLETQINAAHEVDPAKDTIDLMTGKIARG
jgi:hypothetical protein